MYHVDIHRHVPRIEAALAQRLEALTGQDASCCVADLAHEARALHASAAFQTGLARAKALGDEKRFTILALLQKRGSMCACEVQAALGLTHATVSHHMNVLSEAGLIDCEKRGKWCYYSLTPIAKKVLP